MAIEFTEEELEILERQAKYECNWLKEFSVTDPGWNLIYSKILAEQFEMAKIKEKNLKNQSCDREGHTCGIGLC